MFEPKHHITSGHNSQRRQQEDLLAVLVYIMVRAEAQGRLSEESFARRRLQRKHIFDALKRDDGVDTIRRLEVIARG